MTSNVNYCLFLFSIFFFISRTPFISNSLLFFDSPQYAERLTNPNLWQALVSGHPPLHSGYILIFWPIAQLAKIFNLNLIFVVKIVSTFLVWLGFLALFDLLRKVFNKKIALKTLYLIAFLPILWLANLDLLVVNVYLPFFFFGMWCSLRLLQTANLKYFRLTVLSLIITFLAHPVSLIYWPGAFLLLMFSFKKTKVPWKRLAFSWITALFLAQISLFILYIYGRAFLPKEAIYWLFLGKLNEHVQLRPLWLGFLRVVRNFVVLNFSSFTVLFTIVGLLALIKVFKKQKKLGIALALWFLPNLLAAQWWDGLLQGRHLILSAIPLAIAIVLAFRNLWLAILANLVVAGLGVVLLTRPPTPQELVQKSLKKLPQNGLYLEGHFWRPWTVYPNTIFINEPFWPKNKIKEIISENLDKNQSVFVSSQALSEPYGLYSGSVIHPLTLSFRKPPTLRFIEENYKLSPAATPSAKKHLTIYKIERGKNNPGFQNDSVVKWSRERIDFWDSVFQLMFVCRNLLVKYK